MPIVWRKAMSVGNDLIDHDHHFMVNFLNTIELLLQKPDQKEIQRIGKFQRSQSRFDGH